MACAFLFKLSTFRSCDEVESVIGDAAVMKVNHRSSVAGAREWILSRHLPMPSRPQVTRMRVFSAAILAYKSMLYMYVIYTYTHHIHKEKKIASAQVVEKEMNTQITGFFTTVQITAS